MTYGMLCVQAASEDELRHALGLVGMTSGKGKVDLRDSSMRPCEVFMCSVVRLLPWGGGGGGGGMARE